MTYQFSKMQGAGNDYIYFDCMDQMLPEPEKAALRFSDRHFGVGGDGIVLICPSLLADARMRMFNLDGSEGRMCGNAIRCVAKYLYERRHIHKSPMKIETLSGIKELYLEIKEGTVASVTVNMGKAELRPREIPVLLAGERAVDTLLWLDGKEYRVTCVSMGNPHMVLFGEDPNTLSLSEIGPRFERHPVFPQGVNVEFVQVLDAHHLKMRVWERGSGETLACGTGACAAVTAAVLGGHCQSDTPVEVALPGGVLTIRYTNTAVWMTGPAAFVFDGQVEWIEETGEEEQRCS